MALKSAQARADEPDLISLHAAGELLQAHPRTIRRMVSAGQLTGYRPRPRLTRVDRRQVLALIAGSVLPSATSSPSTTVSARDGRGRFA